MLCLYKIKGIKRLQKWMNSLRGQIFLNFAYSWGASIVILGALFKLTHVTGADLMLFIGMGTEVFVFFLAGFEHQTAIDEEGKNTYKNQSEIMKPASVPSEDTILPSGPSDKIQAEYTSQLDKIKLQNKNLNKIIEQTDLQIEYIQEINNIYTRILNAHKGTDGNK